MPEIVCKLCGGAVEFIEKEGVWRHAGDPRSGDPKSWIQSFCDRYGYPVPPEVRELTEEQPK